MGNALLTWVVAVIEGVILAALNLLGVAMRLKAPFFLTLIAAVGLLYYGFNGLSDWWNGPAGAGPGQYTPAPLATVQPPASVPPPAPGTPSAALPPAPVVTPPVVGPPRTSSARSIPPNLPQIVPMPVDDLLTATHVPPDPRYSPRIVPAELLPPPAPPIEQDDFATVVERRTPRR